MTMFCVTELLADDTRAVDAFCRISERRNLKRMGSRFDRTPRGMATMRTSPKASSPYSTTSSKGTKSTWRICRRAAFLTRTAGPMSGERGENRDRSRQVVAPPPFPVKQPTDVWNVLNEILTSIASLLQYLLHCRSQMQADRHQVHEAALRGNVESPWDNNTKRI